MLSKIRAFVKGNFNNIMLFAIIALLVLLAFAAGFIVAKYQSKAPIQIEQYRA